jgi:hypothetical protein
LGTRRAAQGQQQPEGEKEPAKHRTSSGHRLAALMQVKRYPAPTKPPLPVGNEPPEANWHLRNHQL